MTDLINNVPTENDVYKTLLESTKAIPWKLDWASMQFTYIGPQIEALLGWEPSSWKSVEDWAARMHEDERQWVVDYCVSQSKSGIDHEADYRALTKDGNYYRRAGNKSDFEESFHRSNDGLSQSRRLVSRREMGAPDSQVTSK